jgi:ABC-2 type transport system permease protein
MLNRIKRMLVKEFLQMFRDPRMRVVIFGMPVIQLVVLSFALTMDVTDIPTAVYDQDNSVASRELAAQFGNSGYFDILEYIPSNDRMVEMLDEGHARVVIRIPSDFEEDLMNRTTADLQVIADGTDSNTTSIVFGYVTQIVAQYNREKLRERFVSMFGTQAVPGEITIQQRAWYNENLQSRYYYVPGLIGVMLILVSIVVASIAIVREKEMGTIEQVMVTPIGKTEFILGKTVPYLITGFIIMFVMFVIAFLVFGIRIKGSMLLLTVLTGIYLVGNLGIALLISVTSRTQQQALLTAFFVLMPAILLSGFVFPIHNMPVPVQYATYLNPMRWYMEVLRGVILKGVGIQALSNAILWQTILAVSFLIVAISRFRKTLD